MSQRVGSRAFLRECFPATLNVRWVRRVSLKPCSLHVGNQPGTHRANTTSSLGGKRAPQVPRYQTKPLSIYQFSLDVPHHSGDVSCSGQSWSHYQMAWCSSHGNTPVLLRKCVRKPQLGQHSILSVVFFSCQNQSCKSQTFTVKQRSQWRIALIQWHETWFKWSSTVHLRSLCFALIWPLLFVALRSGQEEFGKMSSWNQCVFQTGQKHIEIHGSSISICMLDWWMFINVPASRLSLPLSDPKTSETFWIIGQARAALVNFFLSVQGTDHRGVCRWSSQFSTPYRLVDKLFINATPPLPKAKPGSRMGGGVKEACFFAFVADSNASPFFCLFRTERRWQEADFGNILSAPSVEHEHAAPLELLDVEVLWKDISRRR